MGKCQQKLQEVWRNLDWLGMICQYAAYVGPTAEIRNIEPGLTGRASAAETGSRPFEWSRQAGSGEPARGYGVSLNCPVIPVRAGILTTAGEVPAFAGTTKRYAGILLPSI